MGYCDRVRSGRRCTYDDNHRGSCSFVVNETATAECERILQIARARRAQYMIDGYDRLADVVSNLMAEIER